VREIVGPWRLVACSALALLPALVGTGCGCSEGSAVAAVAADPCSRFDLSGGFAVSEATLCKFRFSKWSAPGGTGTATIDVLGPDSPCGAGSLRFELGPEGATEEVRLDGYDGLALSALTGLQYSTWTAAGSDTEAVAIVVRVDWNDDGTADDVLTFEPRWQDGSTERVPDQGPVVAGLWQDWDAFAGGWWATATPGFMPGAGVRTLAEYLSLHPGAEVASGTDGLGGFALSAGHGPEAPGFSGAVDCLRVHANGSVAYFDFEP
jgi:hypothetical protein